MSAQKQNQAGFAGGYESLVWVNDEAGQEFSCSLDTYRTHVTRLDQLSEHERQSCLNVNQFVGTERW